MKRAFIIATVCILAAFCASCQKDTKTLDGTYWRIYQYEDLFNGSVVYSGELDGDISAEYYDDLSLYISIPEWTINSYYSQEDGEFNIVKYTDSKLVTDIFCYTYPWLKKSDCEPIDTFHGKIIYTFYDSGSDYYVYFNSYGIPIDLDYDVDDYGDTYWYDCSRLYASRR